MQIGIVGCGLIGKKRAAALRKEDNISVVCDINEKLAGSLAVEYNCGYVLEWQKLLEFPIDAVIISSTHDTLAEISHFFLKHKIHILVEKPAARNYNELKPVYESYLNLQKDGIIARVGFNHRFHPALLKAKEILSTVEPEDMMFIRGRYGHGGRIGYDKEWRAIPEKSGGGELLDQGMHLIDLSRWFLGNFSKVHGVAKTYYWDMPVDDNAFLTLETDRGQISQLQVTWTEWKNLFSFEIYSKTIKLHIEGLGGSYGVERLSYYQMKPEMGPPETIIFEYPGADLSWKKEWEDFTRAIEGDRGYGGNLEDALEALKIVKTVYNQNKNLNL